ncbi:MAG: putative porin [Bacteroidota bacterium]|nr:putative porin [Bacteroidota bacterium]
MKRWKLHIMLIFMAGILSLHVSAQHKEPQQMGGSQGKESLRSKREHQEKEKKDSIPVHIKTFTVNRSGLVNEPTTIDSTLEKYHIYSPLEKKSISSTQLGNLGSPAQSNEFFNRARKSEFYFYQNFESFALFPEEIKYYNTTVPFTFLEYSQSENKSTKSETRFNVLHTQNINKFINIGLQYRSLRSMGQYLKQDTKDHVINLFGSYTGKPYQLYMAFVMNDVSAIENGGMQTDSDVNDYNKKTEDILFRLSSDAQSRVNSAHFFVGQEYRLGYYKDVPAPNKKNPKQKEEVFVPRASFIHQLTISTEKKSFSDANPDESYYKNIYISKNVTGDTTRLVRFANSFQLKAYEAPDRKYTFGKLAYLDQDIVKVKYPALDGYTQKNYTNVWAGGRIFRTEGKFWNWSADGKFCFAGYKRGDYSLDGYIYKPVTILGDTVNFRARGIYRSTHPDYLQEHYFSNHRKWDNDFNSTQELRMNYEIDQNGDRFKLGMNYSLIGNYIYNGTDGLPAQVGKEFSVISFYTDKKVKLGRLNLEGQAVWQKVSNDNYLHLPLFSAMGSIYYYFMLAKVMHVQLGTDCRYYTKFYVDAYDPATSSFYLQNEMKIGNYPNIDLYARLKLKRTQAFFKLINAADGLIGKNNFGALHYPMNRLTFRLGLSWTFYN